MIYSLIISLMLAIVIESICSFILGLRKDDIKIVILANISTNPITVYIANCVLLLRNSTIFIIVVIIIEILVIVIEAYIFKRRIKYNIHSTIAISFINNIVSFLIGLLINFII